MHNFKRVVLLLILFLIVGCSTTQVKNHNGTYNVSIKGHNNDIKINVVIDNDKIKDVVIKEHEETPGVSDAAINKLPKMIVDYQTVNIDAMSGCTVTSNAIINGVKTALKEAGFADDAFNKKIDVVNKGETETLKADVVIVGGGGAGLAAANSALESGASVIIIDKMSSLGGNTAAADGLYNAVDRGRQEKLGIKDSIENFYKDTFNGGDKKAKPELVKILTEQAMTALDWLVSKGLKLDDKIYVGTGGLWPRGHYGQNHKGADYTSILENYAREKGAKILTDTKGVELLIDDNGKVIGVKAESKEKDYLLYANGGVVLATGGFGFNVELRQKYNKYWPNLGPDVKSSNVSSATGDGIIMAEKIGANLIGMEYIQFYPVGDAVTGKLGSTLPGGTDARIAINKEGKRFMAEDSRRDVQSKAIFSQTDGVCYVVVDSDTIDTAEKIKKVQKYIDNGEVIMGKTVEELAKNLGIDPAVLKNTFDNYNKYVDEGKDSEFGRVLLKEKMDKAPFYAGLRAPTIHHTMGGIEINSNAEVLNKDGKVIEGLYAAGEVTGGIHGSNRLGGNALADVMVFGRIAGDNAAKRAKK